MGSNTIMSEPKCSDMNDIQKQGEWGLPDQGASIDTDDHIQSKQNHRIREHTNSASTSDNKSLVDLKSHPPYNLKFMGSFDKAMDAACDQDKWLLVNLQCREDASSHKLNQDTWAHEAISQIISTNFIFWQEYFDQPTDTVVSRHYKLDSRTLVLIIDPISGQALRLWNGMVRPDDLLVPPQNQVAKEEEEQELQHALEALLNAKATEEDEEEDLKRAFEASMESIMFERSTSSTSEEDIVPPINTSLVSTKVSEEVDEERLHALEGFVKSMKLEASTGSTFKGAAQEEEKELQLALSASMESESESSSIMYLLTEDDREDSQCAMADLVNSVEPSCASTSKVNDNEDEKLMRALETSLESLRWGTEEEDEEEELHRALAASVQSMSWWESCGSTPKQDLVPFFSRDEDEGEELHRALAALDASLESLRWGTKEEEDEEELHRALAASMESMRWESCGSTPKQDLVPFFSSGSTPKQDLVPFFSRDEDRDEDEELRRALVASVESLKLERRTNTSSSARKRKRELTSRKEPITK